MTVDEGEVLRRDTCAGVRSPPWICSVGEQERRHVDMEPITCLRVAVHFHIDRVVKQRESTVFLVNTHTFIEEPLKLLSVLHLDGETRGSHAVVQPVLHHDAAVTVAVRDNQKAPNDNPFEAFLQVN
ncbi:hypothetical protein [Nonomuraea sp. NPDC005650]|uniref:hypothetical protein n=1 Tax=Nonomuraea sp. NPDC005650 TaxID=3157045 RepID=UPI0033A8C804